MGACPAVEWSAIVMAPAEDATDWKVDRLLADWYDWRRQYKMTRGYASRDSTCRDYRSPGHWDWKNGAADARADEIEMRQVDAAIDRVPNLPQPWNTAIQFEAMNLHSGTAVWSSPRLPQDPEEREVLRLEARAKLMTELRRMGVI